ncbi:SDR family NAD(P)-dependent oxidoreductase [Liberiplasma polymorphum]|uniref:SDR family NAD(P)-dependent oxidoreductase n=1 Tax=Liberiplasma polymorphum TaxID=3374570 RepID=UPI00377443A4
MQKTIVITGVTSGIGKALIHHFASKNEHVIGISRNKEKLDLVLQELNEKYPNHQVKMMTCDFSSFRDMQRTTQNLQNLYKDGIDILINNAAIVTKAKKFTIDDYEMQYQVNHLAVAYFTIRLKELIIKKNGRVITTSSDAHKRANFAEQDLQAIKKYHPFRSYCRTKLYNIIFTLYIDKVYDDSTINFYAVHPGRVRTEIGTKDTSVLYALFWKWFTKNGFEPEEVVSTYDMLVYDKVIENENYFYQNKPLDIKAIAYDLNYQEILWEETMKAIFPYL